MRSAECVARWPECESGAYDPRCCRFPKSCSCEVSVLDVIAKAKRAQQLYDKNNNVQLEMDLNPEQEEDHAGDDCPDEH